MGSGTLTLELGSDPAGGCPCCDPAAAFPQGYISQADMPYAVYFADWHHSPGGTVELLISVGDWGRGSEPEDRCAAAFEGRMLGGQIEWLAIDAAQSLWRDLRMTGAPLLALEVEAAPEFRNLACFIAVEDGRVLNALKQTDGQKIQKLRPRPGAAGVFRAEPARRNKN